MAIFCGAMIPYLLRNGIKFYDIWLYSFLVGKEHFTLAYVCASQDDKHLYLVKWILLFGDEPTNNTIFVFALSVTMCPANLEN